MVVGGGGGVEESHDSHQQSEMKSLFSQRFFFIFSLKLIGQFFRDVVGCNRRFYTPMVASSIASEKFQANDTRLGCV